MALTLDMLKGWWKLSDAWHEFDIFQRQYPFGVRPTGSFVITEDFRLMAVVFNSSGLERHTDSQVEAYSGPFVFEGSQIIANLDMSSTRPWERRELRLSLSLSRDCSQLFATAAKRFDYALYSGCPFTTAYNWYRAPKEN
jgi:hypothetical protein